MLLMCLAPSPGVSLGFVHGLCITYTLLIDVHPVSASVSLESPFAISTYSTYTLLVCLVSRVNRRRVGRYILLMVCLESGF